MALLFVDAVRNGRLTKAKLLHKHGVSVDSTDSYGHPAVYLALTIPQDKLRFATVSWLLRGGAQISYVHPPSGRNLLATATYHNCTAEVQLLLGQGSLDVRAQDGQGRTPLHYAVLHNNLRATGALVRYARRYALDLHVHDNRGWSPEQLAEAMGLQEILDLLNTKYGKAKTPRARKSELGRDFKADQIVDSGFLNENSGKYSPSFQDPYCANGSLLGLRRSNTTVLSECRRPSITPCQRPHTSVMTMAGTVRPLTEPRTSQSFRAIKHTHCTDTQQDIWESNTQDTWPPLNLEANVSTITTTRTPSKQRPGPRTQIGPEARKQNISAATRQNTLVSANPKTLFPSPKHRSTTTSTMVPRLLALQSQEHTGSFRTKASPEQARKSAPKPSILSKGSKKGSTSKKLTFGIVAKLTSLAVNFRRKKRHSLPEAKPRSRSNSIYSRNEASEPRPTRSRANSTGSRNTLGVTEGTRGRPRSGRVSQDIAKLAVK